MASTRLPEMRRELHQLRQRLQALEQHFPKEHD
jgi:hypothetical protein